MKRLIALLVIFVSIHISATEPPKVKLWGTVCDAGGTPLENVVVCISGTTTGTVSSAKGNYQLNLPPGKYNIAAVSLGYITFEKEVILNSSTRLNIILQPSNTEIDQVDVLAKSKSQIIRESALSVNALDLKQTVSTTNNLAAIVGQTNGINIRTNGGEGADFDLSVNGLAGNSVRYFIDGRPMASLGNGTSLANLPVSTIDRVEIYKGVVPVNLGADALGGAINVVTKKECKNFIDASYSIGSFNTHRADVNGQFLTGENGLVIRPSFAFNHSDNDYMMHNIEVWNSATKEFENRSLRRFHDKYTSYLGRIEAGVTNRKWADEFLVTVNATQADKQLQTGSIQSVVYGNATRKSDSQSAGFIYKKNNLIINGLSADIYYTHTEDKRVVADTVFRKYRWDGSYIESSRNEITGRGKSLRTTRRPLDAAGATFTQRINPANSLVLNYSLNSVKNKLTDSYDSDFEPSDDKFSKHIAGLSYNSEWFDGRLNAMVFTKYYHSRLSVKQNELYWITGSDEQKGTSTTNNYGGGAGLRYKITEAFSAKASMEHSVRLPLAREFLGNGTTIYPNFKLKPESSNNINAGVFGTFVISAQNRFNYEINGFIRDVDDYIRLKVSESDGMSQYQNVNSVNVKGVEAELKYTFNNTLDIATNFSYLHELSKTRFQDNGKPDITYNNRMPNRPWLFANMNAAYSFHNVFGGEANRLMLMCDLRYVHWFYLTWEGYGALKSKSTIPTQFVTNAAISYRWKRDTYSLTVSSSNIFDRIVYDNYMLQKPGRSIDIKFRILINNL